MPIHSVDLDRQEAIRAWLATHKLKLNGFSLGIVVCAMVLFMYTPVIGGLLAAVGGLMFFAGRNIGK